MRTVMQHVYVLLKLLVGKVMHKTAGPSAVLHKWLLFWQKHGKWLRLDRAVIGTHEFNSSTGRHCHFHEKSRCLEEMHRERREWSSGRSQKKLNLVSLEAVNPLSNIIAIFVSKFPKLFFFFFLLTFTFWSFTSPATVKFNFKDSKVYWLIRGYLTCCNSDCRQLQPCLGKRKKLL